MLERMCCRSSVNATFKPLSTVLQFINGLWSQQASWFMKKKRAIMSHQCLFKDQTLFDMEQRANVYSGLMKVRRDTRMTIHPLFRPSSFSKVCAEIWKKSLHCALPIAQSRCAKGEWFCTLGRWEGHQGQVGSHISVNVEDIWMPTWHFHLRQQPLICNQDSVCYSSQCIFSLCRVICFHNSVALKIPQVGIVWVVLGWVLPCTL